MDFSPAGLVFYQIVLSLFVAVIFVDLADQLLSINIPDTIEKTTIYEKIEVLFIGFVIVEAAWQYENTAFDWYNSVASWQVSGIAKYTQGFVLIGSFIEEALKVIAISLLVWRYGYKKVYPTIGVSAFFAGLEHFYFVNRTDFFRTNEIIENRLVTGTQWIHIGNALLLLIVITVMNNYRILNQYKFKVPIYLVTFVMTVLIHAYYNYIVIMAGFGEYLEVTAIYISWIYIVILFILWTYLLSKVRVVKPSKMVSENPK